MEKALKLSIQCRYLVGASGFEPPASWSRTRCLSFLLLSTIDFLVFPSSTYEDIVENRGTLNSAMVGTILGTVPARRAKAGSQLPTGSKFDAM
jgi:hypothetical protein